MVEASCLAGCAANYSCGELQLPGPAGQQAESFAPWVWVKIGDGDQITVGNESYPAQDNKACIKSFEVGWISTPTVQLEIIDEAGGRMGALLDSLVKCPSTVGINTEMQFQFGWIINTCEKQKQVIPSIIFKSVINKIEVNYSEGKIKYKICGDTTGPLLEQMRENEPFGTSKQKINIETAIRNLCSRLPQVNVRFMKMQADGKNPPAVKATVIENSRSSAENSHKCLSEPVCSPAGTPACSCGRWCTRRCKGVLEADAKVWKQYVRACLVLEPVEAALDTITATMSDYQLSSETVQSILRRIRAQIAESL